MKRDEASREDDATIHVTKRFRKWLKIESAKKDTPVYRLVEQLVAIALEDKRPWERLA